MTHSTTNHQLLREIIRSRWMPRFDRRYNKITNYAARDRMEKEYQEFLQRQDERLKNLISLYRNEDGTIDHELFEDKIYQFLTMSTQERLAIPDSKFTGDGTYDSICWPHPPGKTSCHKGGLYTKYRVPSLRRSKATWEKFYNTFPWLAAEVRFGYRRFINGAKLKHIW